MSDAPSTIRHYEVRAQSAPVFGRVLCNARNHHFVVDGPIQNGCPGEAITPPELLLSAVVSCGVELMHVIARDENIPLESVVASVNATVDRGAQPRTDVTLFNDVRLRFGLAGPDARQASTVVEGFKRRCPIYGTIAVASLAVRVDFDVLAAGVPAGAHH